MEEQRAIYLRGLVENGRPVIGLIAPEDLEVSYLLTLPLGLPIAAGALMLGPDGVLSVGAGLQQAIDGWYYDDVPGTLGSTVMPRLTGAAQNAFIPVRAGSITGVCVWSNAARTGGTLTVEVYKNGSATGLQAILNASYTTFKATLQDPNIDTFVAGDRLDVRIVTSSWTPTTADVRATMEVQG